MMIRFIQKLFILLFIIIFNSNSIQAADFSKGFINSEDYKRVEKIIIFFPKIRLPGQFGRYSNIFLSETYQLFSGTEKIQINFSHPAVWDYIPENYAPEKDIVKREFIAKIRIKERNWNFSYSVDLADPYTNKVIFEGPRVSKILSLQELLDSIRKNVYIFVHGEAAFAKASADGLIRNKQYPEFISKEGLYVTSDPPGADFYIDGKHYGKTTKDRMNPINLLVNKAFRVTVSKKDWKNPAAQMAVVYLKQSKIIHFKLEPADATLRIITFPKGLNFTLSGGPESITDVTNKLLTLKAGEYRLQVDRPKKKPLTIPIILKQGQKKRIALTFNKKKKKSLKFEKKIIKKKKWKAKKIKISTKERKKSGFIWPVVYVAAGFQFGGAQVSVTEGNGPPAALDFEIGAHHRPTGLHLGWSNNTKSKGTELKKTYKRVSSSLSLKKDIFSLLNERFRIGSEISYGTAFYNLYDGLGEQPLSLFSLGGNVTGWNLFRVGMKYEKALGELERKNSSPEAISGAIFYLQIGWGI